MPANFPFVQITDAKVVSRIQTIRAAIKSTLKVGCSPSNARELAAAFYDLKDYNTLKGLFTGEYYEARTDLSDGDNYYVTKPVGVFKNYEEAQEAFLALVAESPEEFTWELLCEGQATGTEANARTANPNYVEPIDAQISDYPEHGQLIIGDTVISDDVNDGSTVDWFLTDREDLIQRIYGYVSEARNGTTRQMMIDDIHILESWDDEFVFDSCSTNDYVSPTKNSELFNEICQEFLDAQKELDDQPTCKIHEGEEVAPNEEGNCSLCNSPINDSGECLGVPQVFTPLWMIQDESGVLLEDEACLEWEFDYAGTVGDGDGETIPHINSYTGTLTLLVQLDLKDKDSFFNGMSLAVINRKGNQTLNRIDYTGYNELISFLHLNPHLDVYEIRGEK